MRGRAVYESLREARLRGAAAERLVRRREGRRGALARGEPLRALLRALRGRQYGYRIIDDLKAGLNYYLTEKGFRGVDEARGLALSSVSETTDVLERDTVIYPKFNREKCIGCGRCEISCADGGHQAIRLGEDRKPRLDPKKCVGCHLCVLVCPQRAITSSRKRVEKR